MASKYHEERSIALMILTLKFKEKPKSSSYEEVQRKCYEFYMDNLEHINNWDLVDISAPHIVGKYLLDDQRK